MFKKTGRGAFKGLYHRHKSTGADLQTLLTTYFSPAQEMERSEGPGARGMNQPPGRSPPGLRRTPPPVAVCTPSRRALPLEFVLIPRSRARGRQPHRASDPQAGWGRRRHPARCLCSLEELGVQTGPCTAAPSPRRLLRARDRPTPGDSQAPAGPLETARPIEAGARRVGRLPAGPPGRILASPVTEHCGRSAAAQDTSSRPLDVPRV